MTVAQKNKNKTKYKVFVDDDSVIHIIEQSNPTEESSFAMKEEVAALVEKTEATLALVDLSYANIPPSGARRNIVRIFKNPNIEKVAIFGPSVSIRVIAKFIMDAVGLNNRKFFETEKEAIEWLKA